MAVNVNTNNSRMPDQRIMTEKGEYMGYRCPMDFKMKKICEEAEFDTSLHSVIMIVDIKQLCLEGCGGML